MRFLLRLAGSLAVLWLVGLGAFALLLPGPLAGAVTDAVVVPTGAAGRIDRGLAVLERHQARRMLVTGVAPEVTAAALARQYHRPIALFACCVDLGRDAVDTYSNADEAAAWVRRNGYGSIRLVTSSWHLPRAELEFRHRLGPGVMVLGDGVRSRPRFSLLVAEYDKFLLRRLSLPLGIGT